MLAPPGKKPIVVIPSESFESYERAGYAERARHRYNPGGMFSEVFAVSPLEKGVRQAYGITIIGTPASDFRKVVREIDPCLVRAFGGYWAADFAARYRLANVPVVVSVHDPNPAMIFRGVRYADLVLCTSSVVRDAVLARGVDSRSVKILPNYVEPSVFHPVAGEQLAALTRRFPAGYHILHVGRRSKEKNLASLLRALVLLPETYQCICVGQGDAAPYQRLAESLGVASRCSWMDALPQAELAAWYSWCDCFCVPSLWEGFGNVFIEAAACGAAVVTARIRPMSDTFVHRESAWLVQHNEDPGEIAEGIRQVCEDATLRKALSSQAVRVAASFERSRVQAVEASLYSELLASGGKGLTCEQVLWALGGSIRDGWRVRLRPRLRWWTHRVTTLGRGNP